MYRIAEKRFLNSTVAEMKIEAPMVAKKAEAGQFIILRTDESGERIPLTVAGADRERGTVRIIFQVVGATTEKLSRMEAGSCPVDFAYSIHSAVGNKMVGARVNGKLVPIDYQLKSGDRVDIITSQNSKGPSRDWLNIVKSTQARNKINQWFKQELKEDNIIKGKELIYNLTLFQASMSNRSHH